MARVTCLIPKFAHITQVLRELHWSPVKFRVEFKIALLVFKSLNCLASQYLSELLVVKPRTRYSLLPDSETLLVIPKVTRKTSANQAFFHAGPTVWNALPSTLRNCRNIDPFKVQLKTYLFKKAFNLGCEMECKNDEHYVVYDVNTTFRSEISVQLKIENTNCCISCI